jgi:hypothetical protein
LVAAVGEQRHARALDAHDDLHERRAHVRELDQVLGPHLDVGAGVEQQERLPRHRDEQRERRPVDAAGALEGEQRRGQRRAGGTTGNQRVSVAGGNGGDRAHDRGVEVAPHRSGGVRILGDRHRRVDDRDALRGRHLGGGPEQHGADVAARRRQGGAARDLSGAAIGPVDVYRDGDDFSARDRDRGRARARPRARRRTRNAGTPGADGAAGGTAGRRSPTAR